MPANIDAESDDLPRRPLRGELPVTALSDKPLVAAHESARDGGDFAALIVRHDRSLLRYIMTLIPRRDDAEEVLQRTAAKLWEHFADFDSRRPFLPWAFRFAYFEALNFRKEFARDRLVFREDVLEAIVETRESLDPELDVRREALRVCLDGLPQKDVELLQRRYCDSATVDSLSGEIGKTAKSLYRRLDRIRELLAECVRRRATSSTLSGSISP